VLHVASTIVLVVIALGLWYRRRNRRAHLWLMLSAFTADVLLVLYIELTRHAVETVATKIKPIIWFHAGVSLAVLVCYVLMILLGRPMLVGRYETRKLHFIVGVTFVVLRSLNYVTSYMVA
jgi:putative Ca2+/H+ antiporter (TMEM165/GDT1 family)